MGIFRNEHRNLLRTDYPGDWTTYEQLLLSLGEVLEERVLPRSRSLDASGRGIETLRGVVFQEGVCRMPFPAESGGLALPFGVYAMAMELVGSADASTALSVAIHGTVADGIGRFGTGAQKRELLAPLLSGDKLAAFALTEASSGSDARAMRTRAVEDGPDHYVIDGAKMFITNAGEASLYLVFAATEKGHAAFLVDSSNPGLAVGAEIGKLGMRGSRTAELRLTNCRVSKDDDLLGVDGQGFEYAKQLLSTSRIVMGMICVGIARTAYQKALSYSTERRLFDARLSEMQLTREKIANVRTEMTASRLLCMHASRLKEMSIEFASEAAQAKVMATEMAVRACDIVVQIHGGYGFTDEDIHRHWRDARLLTIGEGASEVLRMLIASMELADAAK